MPTTLKRTMVTHTAPLQEAIEIGLSEWPGISLSECITRMTVERGKQLKEERAKRVEEWRAIVYANAGGLEGAYPDRYLEEIREGWPE